ncbi:ABC transporter permease [Telmatobacter sp. DSM 110680]|uniref:ABC transporter permease n=1 Tax=Telmatobacter sp. DSM 110680 TaxID=3036704 RepID=A0AAU7DJ48_9BACT
MTGDLRVAFRKLWKSPGFAITAIVTLALGIGANAVVFSILNAVVLRPVKLPNAQNLYEVQRFQYPSHSYPDYVDMRDRNRTFDSMVMTQIMGPVGVDVGGSPSTAWPYMASGNYFDALGIQPYLGRFYHASDEQGAGSAPYVVLSYAYWHGYFHGDASVVGRTVKINKHQLTIIGVAPAEFRGTELFFAPAMWIPMTQQPTIEGYDVLKQRGNHNGFVVGRLKPGVTAAQATADLNALGGWLSKTYPGDDDGVKFTLARPGLIGDMLGGPARAFMAGLMLLAGLILLAACANLGSLFAARAADRAKETALRLALGSRRGMILRQLLTEAVMVSLAGGAIGLAGGVVILRILSTWQPIPDTPINVPVNPDTATYVVALVLALASGLLFGMVPVRQVLRSDPWQVIRTGAAGVGGLRRFTLRDVLLAVQISICAVLVTSSLVAVRGLARSMHSNFGFVPQNVTLAGTELHMSGYTDDRELQMQQRMLEAAESIPGATAAGYVDHLPLGLEGGDSFVYADSTTDYRPTNVAADAMDYHISRGYIQAAGTTLLAGRDLRMQDDAKAPKVALVNRQFAVKVFGSVSKAIGGHFKFNGGQRAEVVGVVEDGKYRTLTEDQQPAMFFSFLQERSSNTWLLVRSNRDPQEISAALEKALHGLDSAMPLAVRPWTDAMGSALFAARVASVALGVLGLLGAMLAVTGIFGMASYTVCKRLRELGIRMALGASRKRVLRAALGRAFMLLSVGSLVGLALGLLATKVLSFIVYQASPNDPVVLAGVVFTMLLLGLAAAWMPAQKALGVNPVILMREE